MIIKCCGRSSVVERQLPKLYVEGSIPFARSIFGDRSAPDDARPRIGCNTDRQLGFAQSRSEKVEFMMSLSPSRAQTLSRGFHRVVWAAALVLIIGAGLILWAARGEAVFFDLAASLYAMCF